MKPKPKIILFLFFFQLFWGHVHGYEAFIKDTKPKRVVYITSGSYDTTELFSDYRAQLEHDGYRVDLVSSISNLHDFDLLITINVPIHEVGYLEKIPKEKLVLLVHEPPTVHPWNHMAHYHEYYSRVYTWDDRLIDNKKYFRSMYNVISPMIPTTQIPSFDEKKLCTIICGKHYSTFPGELYSERLRAIKFYETSHPNDLNFYGVGWSPNVSSLYRGAIANKQNTLKGYKFSICYENVRLPGYITEKIFDCFSAGVVPIYLGAPNIGSYVPKNCFIARDEFSSDEEVYQFIKNMTREKYINYIENIEKYLKTDLALIFSSAALYEKFDEVIRA